MKSVWSRSFATIQKCCWTQLPKQEMEAELLRLLSTGSFLYYSSAFPGREAVLRPLTPPPDTHGGVLKVFLDSPSLTLRSLWGRNLISGKYHHTWQTRGPPRPPPAGRCLGSSQGDRCRLILWSAAPVLLCQHGCAASWGRLQPLESPPQTPHLHGDRQLYLQSNRIGIPFN